MNKKIVVISTSLRAGSNSDQLAKAFAKGAEDAGNQVTYLTLKNKNIQFCRGCLACQQTGVCVIQDDAIAVEQQVLGADVVVFATPIYYYEMSGQMKTLLDRMNSLYPKDYAFRDIYLLATAAEDEEETPSRAIAGLQGWIDCFEKAALKGVVFCGGVDAPNQAQNKAKCGDAYEMGRRA
ncbi:MAG: flavodoxin family protein [Oscillospiraceae bacterium]|nr:flavodoxin family protein [Oscillospiraceae bacterium]